MRGKSHTLLQPEDVVSNSLPAETSHVPKSSLRAPFPCSPFVSKGANEGGTARDRSEVAFTLTVIPLRGKDFFVLLVVRRGLCNRRVLFRLFKRNRPHETADAGEGELVMGLVWLMLVLQVVLY